MSKERSAMDRRGPQVPQVFFAALLAGASLLVSAGGCAAQSSDDTSAARAQAVEAFLPEARPERIDSLAEATRSGLVFVEGGSFQMGDVGAYFVDDPETGEYYTDSAKAEEAGARYMPWTPAKDDAPAHPVTLDSYSIQTREVNYGAYDLFTQVTRREPIQRKLIGRRKYRQKNYPAEVNWHEARAYCRWIGKQAGVDMDLPTEAQWEYAARSRGKNVAAATDNGVPDPGRNLTDGANLAEPVGEYPPNPLGLYDMSYNAWEWTLDWYSEDYYARSPEQNPEGPGKGTEKVLRSNSTDSPRWVRVYSRRGDDPKSPSGYTGFRCVANSTDPVE